MTMARIYTLHSSHVEFVYTPPAVEKIIRKYGNRCFTSFDGMKYIFSNIMTWYKIPLVNTERISKLVFQFNNQFIFYKKKIVPGIRYKSVIFVHPTGWVNLSISFIVCLCHVKKILNSPTISVHYPNY